MQIKLTGVPAYYINLELHEERGKKTEEVLSNLGFHSIRKIPGFPHKNYVTGCAMAHLNALESLVKSGGPFLIFEDDIMITHFDHMIDIPEDADAVYLGVSKMGLIKNKHQELIVADKVNNYENLYRIYNMLSGHAILYLNSKYVEELIKEIKRCIQKGKPVDIAMATQMSKGIVYALNKPMFIQDGKFRSFTDTPIDKLNNLTSKTK